jgi:NADH-quinone oxidoreductase subunit N
MRTNYAAIAPEIIVAAAACIALVVDLALRGRARIASAILSLVAVLGALASAIALADDRLPIRTLGGMFVLDGFALVFKGFFLAVAVLVILLSVEYMRGHRYEGEYYFLLLCSVLGTMLMPSSRDLVMLFISLELVSAPAFILAGIRKHDPRSNEAAIKFFLFGVLSAGVLVYGISLVYGLTGATSLTGIASKVSQGPPKPLLVGALMLIVAAFGFKVSAVPFHFWAPDTYEGSPAPLAAFLSVASKAAGFAGLGLILLIGFAPISRYWAPIVAGISAATMTVGNVLALRQRHLVRLLAYSSIAQAGYMLIPVAIIRSGSAASGTNRAAISGLLIYVLIYAVMNLGAFSIAIGLWKQYPTLLIRDLAGLGRRSPFHAAAMTAFLLSLGGIPPLAGWAAKFFVFLAAVNVHSSLGVALGVIMVVNSVVSLYYYVGVARALYLSPPTEDGTVRFPVVVSLVTSACLAGVVFFGVYPEALIVLGRAGRIVP